MNKLINSILIAVTLGVALIFIVGVFKKNSVQEVVPEQRIDQSSMGNDELTNKYIKELQTKLRQESEASLNQMKRAQKMKLQQRPKDDDWRQVPIDQQISKDNDVSYSRQTAGSVMNGSQINKDNAAEFIATARKNGYHVVLSESYEVISITPIMNTKGVQDTFETNPAE